ncbi:MAG TPA: L,D-transpeptidase family protein [Acidimicrobiales bacterium]|nr:L,D-transpeptidase family protein [Acidimicrobiales bacterium]
MRRLTTSQLVAAALAIAVSTAACANGDNPRTIATDSSTSSTSTSTTSTSTTTTTVAPIVAPAGLGAGARGAEVTELERQLDAQRYDVGKIDGVFDATTGHAVMAFQKVHGLKRTSRATPDVLDLVGKVGAPGPLLASGGANRVEVDLKRQVLMLYKGGSLFRTLNVSTGSGKRYCVDGQCATAVTPGGSYKVFFRRNGLRVSRLGKLWNPLYFNGGIAIHGAPSVPGYPASHGCVRIPMSSSTWFPSQVPNGTPVYVIGGSKAAVPFNEKAPDGTPPAQAPPSTTTSAPPKATTTSTTGMVPATSTTTPATTTTTP